MKLKHLYLAAAAILGLSMPATAQTVELKIQHFLPAGAPSQKSLIEPWAKAVEAQSGGRIKSRIFPAMQLGGKPPELYDQVRDGIVDVVWTLPSYTPGRFPMMSVFELPFMISDAKATTKAAWEFYQTYARDEFADIHPLLFHVHARGVIHTKGKAVQSADDLKGLKLRAPSRPVGDALAKYGATPVFMPVPQAPEALSKNVVEGIVVPWEVTVSLRLYELTDHHTQVTGPRGLYTSVFLYGMNKKTYEGLPADLKKVIDANSGAALTDRIGQAWEDVEKPGLEAAQKRGNKILTMPAAEAAKLQKMAESVAADWVAEMNKAGKDGAKLLAAAQALIDKHGAKTN
ncbi:MAG TPA: TRAP transporter substrate-binding protein [Ferrovibrio sp.]|jgi:TRAP-type C4-dicarboxylate transport system substrate-binding protein|uniref:TRAP transporter substrate-binding protein n=1 Tax=Ferrovibrio sp. TaxID=1917215 RepID=UPI002B4AAF83|nr:TRAP transporter substrate-binding protein [Ferrovibrio sp.]HLT79063.1 TRAP transporter substrate-binding protein [Ferrovibrio sp.]